MIHYPALVDGEPGAYGVSFPDLPGIVAMGATVEEALFQAEQALQDYASETERAGGDIVPPSALKHIEPPPGQLPVLVSIPQTPLWRPPASVRWWNADAGVAEGQRYGLTPDVLLALEQMIQPKET